MANIYCWLSVESIETGSCASTIFYCGKERDCVEVAKNVDIFHDKEARSYISRHCGWLSGKGRKFRVRIVAGGEECEKVERRFNLKLA